MISRSIKQKLNLYGGTGPSDDGNQRFARFNYICLSQISGVGVLAAT